MERYATKIGKLAPEKGRQKIGYSVAHFYQPEERAKREYGSLYFIIEIASATPQAPEIGQMLIDVITEEYYKNLEKDKVASFERALKQANHALGDVAEAGEISWLGKINAVIGLLENSNLHLTACGTAKAYLLRNDNLTEISQGLADASQNPDPLKTFANIASGQLQIGDKLIFSAPGLFYHLSQNELIKILSEYNPQAAIGQIADILQESEDALGTSLLILEFTTEEELEKETVEELPEEIWIKRPQNTFAQLKDKAQSCLKQAQLFWNNLVPKIKGGIQNIQAKVKKKSTPPSPHQPIEKPIITAKPEVTENRAQDFFQVLKKELEIIIKFIKKQSQMIWNDLKSLKTTDFKNGTKKRYLLIALVSLIVFVSSLLFLNARQNNLRKIEIFESKFQELKDKEAQASAILATYKDRQQAKEILSEAETIANELLKVDYKKVEVENILAQILADKEKAEGIIRISLSELFDLNTLWKDAESKELVFLDDNLYSIDSKNNNLYKYSIKDHKGELAMANFSSNGQFQLAVSINKKLTIYDNSLTVYEYDTKKNQLSAQKISGANTWPEAIAWTSYKTNLYLLVPKENQIYVYPKTASGYAKGSKYIKTPGVDLAKAVDIKAPTFLYVLKENGEILKFSKGILKEFTLQNSPEIKKAKLFFATENNFYLLDIEGKKLVTYNSQGVFQSQYLNDLFGSTSGIYIDEKEAKIYLLAGNKIYEASL